MRLRRRLLVWLQRSLGLFGVARLYTWLRAPDGFLILMYHSVPDSARAPFIDPSNAVPADVFEQQLSLLSKTCSVISLADAIACQKARRAMPDRSVVITFDDGYFDNYEVAAPLLAKYGLPATVFVCTGYVHRQEPQWIDELYNAFRFRQVDSLTLSEYSVDFALDSVREERAAYQFLSSNLLTKGYAARRALLDEVNVQLAPREAVPRLTLRWEDLRAMRREFPNLELGLHTHDHLDLSGIAVSAAIAEIRKSQAMFESEMGFPARYFSYPYGRATRALVDSLSGLGIDAAVVTQPTERVTAATNVYAMPRYEVTKSLIDLGMWSGGALPDLSRRVFGRVAD